MPQPLDEAKTAAAKWKEYSDMTPKLAESALRASLHEARKAGADDFQKRGVGRRIWGSHDPKKGRLLAKDVRKYIQRLRVKRQGDRLESGLKVVGIPALVLIGGRSKPFTIRAKNKALAFAAKSGDRVFSKYANIPGIRYNRYNFLENSGDILEKQFPIKLQKSQDRALKKLGLL